MFERFTERARQVVVLAQEEARTLKHNYIGTEHILLGLLREEEGLAARVLESLDITVERVRAQVVRIVGSGDFTDKLFCSDGQMYATAPDTVPAGDKFCVNGAIQPYFNVSTRKYRFRFLNSGPARIWAFNLYDNNGNPVPMTVITTDGNLLPSPVKSFRPHRFPPYRLLRCMFAAL